MSSCGPPTRDPERMELGSWPSSRSRSRACGTGRAHRTSTSAAGTHRLHRGSCGRSEKGMEQMFSTVVGVYPTEISVRQYQQYGREDALTVMCVPLALLIRFMCLQNSGP